MMEVGTPASRPSISGRNPTLTHLVLHPAVLHVGKRESGAPRPLLGLVCCSQDFALLQGSQARVKARC